MIKIKNIINSLTLDEKLEIIIKDKNSKLSFDKYGINVDSFFIEDMNSQQCGLEIVRNSWNAKAAKLIGSITAQQFYEDGIDNVNIIPSVTLYSKNSNYFSNSPILVGNMAKAYFDGMAENGAYTIPRLFLNELDNQNLSERMQNEIYLKPFEILNSSENLHALYVKSSNISENNFCKIIKDKFDYNGCIFIEDEEQRNVVKRICEGYSLIITYASVARKIVKKAVEQYDDLLTKVNQSLISQEDFNKALSEYEIMDEKVIDTAVANVLTYLVNQDDIKTQYQGKEKDTIITNAMAEASILVKNDNCLLPLKTSFDVLFVGEINQIYGYTDVDFKSVYLNSRYARGYDSTLLGDEEFNSEALKMIKNDTVIVYFINSDNGTIPDNQLVLLKKMYMKNRPIVLVSNNVIEDASYSKYCKSILVAPKNISIVSDILIGELNPSGHLPHTIYGQNETDEIQFSMGHGLTYSDVEYSNLIINVKDIQFTLANRGSYPTYESVQFYVGLPNSSIKELKYFDKIYLEPGECKVISIPLLFEFFEIYNEAKHNFEAIIGKYNVYVGKSSSNIVFTTTIDLNDRHELTDEEINNRLLESAKYLEEVKEDKRGKTPKETTFLKYKTKKILLILSTIYLNGLFIAGIVMSILSHSELYVYILLAAFMFVFNIIIIILFIFLHKSRFDKIKVKIDNFQNVVDSLNTPNFDAELERREIERIKQEEEKKRLEEERIALEKKQAEEARIAEEKALKEKRQRELEDDDEDYSVIETEASIFTESIELDQLIDNLEYFLKQNNLVVERATLCSFISSLTSTRMIIINNSDESISLMFTRLVVDFFKQEHYVLDMNRIINKNELLYSEQKQNKPSDFLRSIFNAWKKSDDFTFTVLDNMTSEKMESIMGFMAPYFQNYEKKNEIEFEFIPLGYEKNTAILSSNVFYMVIMDPEEKNITNDIGLYSSYLELVARVEVFDGYTLEKNAISYSQFKAITSTFEDADLVISEDNWKKLDTVVEKINETIKYEINDLAFIRLEKFSLAYLQMEKNEMEALDSLTSCYVIPTIPSLDELSKTDNGENLSQYIDRTYGTDNTVMLQRAISDLISK